MVALYGRGEMLNLGIAVRDMGVGKLDLLVGRWGE